MSNIDAKVRERMSAARRYAESQMPAKTTAESALKLQQRQEREALADKTQRLRELRLAKQAEDQAAGHAPVERGRARRSKAS